MLKAICRRCFKEIDIDSGQLSSGDPNCPACAARKDGSDLMIRDEYTGLSYVPTRLSTESLPKETDPDPPVIHRLSELMLPYQPKVKWHSLDDEHNKGILKFGGFKSRSSGSALRLFIGLILLSLFPGMMMLHSLGVKDSLGWLIVLLTGLAIIGSVFTLSGRDYIIVTEDTLEFRHGLNSKSAKLLIEIPRYKNIPVRLEVQKIAMNNSNYYNDCYETQYSIFVTNPDTLRTVEVVRKYSYPGTLIGDDAGKELKQMIRTLLFADLR